MEGIDRKIIAALYESNIEFRRLYDEHIRLHEQLAKMENRNYLSTQETLKEKELKMKKLKGREKLLAIVDKNKNVGEGQEYSASQLH